MIFTDSHTHLYLPEFDDDRHMVIHRAIKAGIERMFLPNIDSHTIRMLHSMCSLKPSSLFPMMGLHPCSVDENYLKELSLVEKLLTEKRYAAVGEIGIDLYWDIKFKKEQIEAFTSQVKLAKNHNLAVVIHVRNAFDDVFEVIDLLNDDTLKGIFHCFNGNEQQAMKALSYGGFKLGIGGMITFKNSTLAGVVEKIKLEDIVLETDAPYLTPAPHRGKRNESVYLVQIAKKIAQIKRCSLQAVADVTTSNSREVFGM